MTSEPESTSQRRPPTIDLTATEVGPEKPAPAEGASENATDDSKDPGRKDDAPQSAPARSGSVFKPALASAAITALAVIAIIAGLVVSGYLPLQQPAPQPAVSSSADNKAIADITAQLNKIQGALAAPQTDPQLTARLAAIEAASKSLNDSVSALSTRVDQVAGAAQAAQTQAKSATDAANAAKTSAQGGVTHSDIDTLTSRIAALEDTVKSLSDNVTRQNASADDGTARLALAAEALHTAVERGAPYQAELDMLKSLGADQNTTAPLEPFAASGAPTATALAQELTSLMPALTKAVEPASNDSSFVGRLEGNVHRLVRITPVDAPAGDDPQSVAARIGADAARADIKAALADIAKLPDAAKPSVAAWVQKAQARNAAVAASQQFAANALAALGKKR